MTDYSTIPTAYSPSYDLIRKWFKNTITAGDLGLVKFLIDQNPVHPFNYEEGMCLAAKWDHRHLVDFFISKGASDYNEAMIYAAEGGNRDLVEFFISKGATNYNWSMYAAALAGERRLVDFFISKGATNYNWV